MRSITALLTPGQIRRLWPPKSSELRWLRINWKDAGVGRGPSISDSRLAFVAEPLASRQFSAQLGGGRDAPRSALENALRRGSALVVGESGAGKTTLIGVVARHIEDERRRN